MIFSFLILVGFGTIVYICATLFVRSLIRNRRDPKQQKNYQVESFSSTPEHLRPHYVQKPRNYTTRVVEEAQAENTFTFNKLNNEDSFALRQAKQYVEAQREKTTEPIQNNTLLSDKGPQSYEALLKEEMNNQESFALRQAKEYVNSLHQQSKNSIQDTTPLTGQRVQSYEAFLNERNNNYNRVVDARPVPVGNAQIESPKTISNTSDNYGFSVDNTIPIKSQSDVLRYLDMLKTQQGEKIHYVKTGIMAGPDQFRPIEEYKISIHGEEIANLYFNVNTTINAKRIPQGFTF